MQDEPAPSKPVPHPKSPEAAPTPTEVCQHSSPQVLGSCHRMLVLYVREADVYQHCSSLLRCSLHMQAT